MNIDLIPTSGFPNLYRSMEKKIGGDNPMILILLTVIIVVYYLVFSNISVDTDSSIAQVDSRGIAWIEIFMWGLFIFLILINGLQLFSSMMRDSFPLCSGIFAIIKSFMDILSKQTIFVSL